MKRKLKLGFTVAVIAVVSALLFAACGKGDDTVKGEGLADQAAYQAILDNLPTVSNVAGEGKGVEVVMKMKGTMEEGVESDLTVTATLNGANGYAKLVGSQKVGGMSTEINTEGYLIYDNFSYTVITKKNDAWVEITAGSLEDAANYAMISSMYTTCSGMSLTLKDLLPANLSDMTYSDGVYSFAAGDSENAGTAKVAFKDGKVVSLSAETRGVTMSFTFNYGKTVTIPDYTAA